jgi:activator of HSP90 ATPase
LSVVKERILAMKAPIEQSVKFPCSPEELFEMYMDSAKHSASTGAPAKITRRAGGSFKAFGGALSGRNLLIVPNRLVVQAWRSTAFKRDNPDSILVLEFSKAPGGAKVHLVHVNVPAQDHGGVRKGWPKFYWKPWKAYLAASKRKT